jgi:uncharacterized protein (TIGR00251 family)
VSGGDVTAGDYAAQCDCKKFFHELPLVPTSTRRDLIRVTHVKIVTLETGIRFGVHVQPRASATEITGFHGEALKVRLAAPPVDGSANEALVDFLSERFAVPRRAVTIVSGAHSRAKVIEVMGISADDLRRLVNQK